MSRRHFSRNSFLYLLFPIIFTVGFIFGNLYNSYLNDALHVNISYSAERSMQGNFSYLVVVILSAPENFERRQVIRNTWFQTGNNIVRFYFALSVRSVNSNILTLLKKEHSAHKDLLLLYLLNDSYSKLSVKLQEVFGWIDKNLQYKFLLKVDDDSFVRLDALLNKLKTLPQKKLYWGYFEGQATVKTKGKWKENNWFLCNQYLPYAKGGGYVLSQDLVHLVVSVSSYLSIYQNEDVSLGTWLAPYAIHRWHDPDFDTEFLSRGCLNQYLVTHKQTPAMMLQKYKNLRDNGNLCVFEHEVRNSYDYNWNVLPSQCCTRPNF